MAVKCEIDPSHQLVVHDISVCCHQAMLDGWNLVFIPDNDICINIFWNQRNTEHFHFVNHGGVNPCRLNSVFCVVMPNIYCIIILDSITFVNAVKITWAIPGSAIAVYRGDTTWHVHFTFHTLACGVIWHWYFNCSAHLLEQQPNTSVDISTTSDFRMIISHALTC